MGARLRKCSSTQMQTQATSSAWRYGSDADGRPVGTITFSRQARSVGGTSRGSASSSYWRFIPRASARRVLFVVLGSIFRTAVSSRSMAVRPAAPAEKLCSSTASSARRPGSAQSRPRSAACFSHEARKLHVSHDPRKTQSSVSVSKARACASAVSRSLTLVASSSRTFFCKPATSKICGEGFAGSQTPPMRHTPGAVAIKSVRPHATSMSIV
mmetsp:Transcript_1868/g.4284  ORF Transcript_1868/g.4284 Transcript_1868/m.4284 type:complete len:213 (+) Transcript_1868:2914-3552(+)